MAKKLMTREQHIANHAARTQMRQLAPNLMPGVTADDLEDIRCEECEGTEFSPAHLLKAASGLQTNNSLPTLVQFPLGFRCSNCGALNKLIKQTDLDIKKKAEAEGKEGPA